MPLVVVKHMYDKQVCTGVLERCGDRERVMRVMAIAAAPERHVEKYH
jgi:hypothetical protein